MYMHRNPTTEHCMLGIIDLRSYRPRNRFVDSSFKELWGGDSLVDYLRVHPSIRKVVVVLHDGEASPFGSALSVTHMRDGSNLVSVNNPENSVFYGSGQFETFLILRPTYGTVTPRRIAKFLEMAEGHPCAASTSTIHHNFHPSWTLPLPASSPVTRYKSHDIVLKPNAGPRDSPDRSIKGSQWLDNVTIQDSAIVKLTVPSCSPDFAPIFCLDPQAPPYFNVQFS
jgi:hypothetical protein